MKRRKDIEEYIISQLGDNYMNKIYNVYEQDGLLYAPSYDDEKLTHFTIYDLLWSNQLIVDLIEKSFKVKFPNIHKDKNVNIVVCACGESKSFSAKYGSYELILTCNKCNNEFSAYSG